MNKCYLYYSLISIFVCLSASIVFFAFGNIQGGVWALVAAHFAALSWHIHRLHFSDRLQNSLRLQTLDRLSVLGFIIGVISLAFSMMYIFSQVYWKIPMDRSAYHITPVFPCVFSFITSKWAFHLCTAAKEYINLITFDYSPLVQNV